MVCEQFRCFGFKTCQCGGEWTKRGKLDSSSMRDSLNYGFNMKIRLVSTAFVLVAASLIQACSDECSSYSDFSCSEIESASYNAYFYFPDNSERFLGVARGLSQCGSMAHSFASSKSLIGNREWSYICCMKAKGSECYEKHR